MDHLLLHCEVARALWDDIFSRVGLAWVMPWTVVDLLASWKGLHDIPQIVAIWKIVPICLLQCIWRERNDRNSEYKERSLDELRDIKLTTLPSMLKTRLQTNKLSEIISYRCSMPNTLVLCE